MSQAVVKKLLYVVTEDWYFLSHRLPIARAARDAGYQVTVVTRVERGGGRMRSEGFAVIPLDFQRGRIRPLAEIRALIRLISVYRQVRPDLVHHVALKPVLYGTLAARAASVPCVVNALGGLGFLFSSQGAKTRVLRKAIMQGFRWLFRHPKGRVIVQNPEDRDLLIGKARIDPGHIVMIRGSGVDLEEFHPAPEPPGRPRVAMVSRMLREKGVGELVEAARRLQERGLKAHVVLVGEPDPANPGTVSERELRAWAESRVVEWWGHRDDIATVWREAHICVLPSYYREGVPKSLLEAAACGRPIVTSDAPGCREVVQHGHNGLLVPVRNVDALTDAIARLVVDPGLRARMGRAGRALVEDQFGVERVARETMGVYQSLLGEPPARG
jgi:glycosyltransferase involved in cell wall biosynthesis